MSAIWRRESDEWRPLLPAGFPSEAALHDLVEEAPHLLPLSGDPNLVVVGREVALGPGYADLIAVEADGRLAVIEIKLRRNAEARRAVVAQVLTYAAYLKGIQPAELERGILRSHFIQRPFGSLSEAMRDADQTGTFDEALFQAGLAASLAAGAFRLVLVLDEAPVELVQLIGYLESISAGVVVDLITVSAYDVGDEQILVPQRVDPEHADAQLVAPPKTVVTGPTPTRAKPIDGVEPFEQAIAHAPADSQKRLNRLLAWARDLEDRQLASLKSVLGDGRQVLLLWIPGEKAGLVSIWNDGNASISLWRTVFVRHAWEQIEPIETLTGKAIGQGNVVVDPPDELLELVTAAYEQATENAPEWDGYSYYVSFGDGPERNWEDARQYGFVSAGGGAWYTKTLRQLTSGNRVFVYIPKGNGVGGYVGVGDVTGSPVLAKDFLVDVDGQRVPITDVARADMSHGGSADPEVAEWIVPVQWIQQLSKGDAVRDSDFFANQNSASRFTHGYTHKRLLDAFGLRASP